MDLSLSTRPEGDRTVVVVGGELDVYTAPTPRDPPIDPVSAGNYLIVVDDALDAATTLGPETNH